MLDITNDKDLSFFAIALENAPIKPLELIKQANVDEPFSEYSSEVFADPINKQFPIHSPEHTAISAVYLYKQANEIDLDVKQRMEEAINRWGLNELSQLLDGEKELKKEASSDMYILPSKNKFPVHDIEGLVKTASVVKSYVNVMPLDDKVEAASNLIKTAEEFGVNKNELDDWVLVYGQELPSNLYKVAEELSIRHAISQHDGYKNLLTKIAKLKNQVGDISFDKSLNRGIAFEMLELDKVAGIQDEVKDVFSVVFNTKAEQKQQESLLGKFAEEEGFTIGDTEFYKQDLVEAIEQGIMTSIVGEDLIKEASVNEIVEAEEVLSKIAELPEELQLVIAEKIKEG